MTLVAAKQGGVCASCQDGWFRAPETEGVCQGNPSHGSSSVPRQSQLQAGLWDTVQSATPQG